MTPAIEVDELTRAFGKVVALDGVSLSVQRGEILAMLGANGAGKTTLTKILATILFPSSGTARILGMDVVRDERRVRLATSVIFGGDRGLYGQLTAMDNLRYFAVLRGLGRKRLRQRLAEALEEVGLSAAADRMVQTFSTGMRQRLHIAIGMISEPEVLLLDEPTLGLDPVEAQRLRETIAGLRTHGVTVLLTSHHLLDVERLADRVVLLEAGRISHDLLLPDFIKQAGYAATVVITGEAAPPRPDTLRASGLDVMSQSAGPGEWEVRLRVKSWGPEVFREISRTLAESVVSDVRVEQVRLEDAFAAIAGRSP